MLWVCSPKVAVRKIVPFPMMSQACYMMFIQVRGEGNGDQKGCLRHIKLLLRLTSNLLGRTRRTQLHSNSFDALFKRRNLSRSHATLDLIKESGIFRTSKTFCSCDFGFGLELQKPLFGLVSSCSNSSESG